MEVKTEIRDSLMTDNQSGVQPVEKMQETVKRRRVDSFHEPIPEPAVDVMARRILRLPRELRDNIYDHIIGIEEDREYPVGFDDSDDKTTMSHPWPLGWRVASHGNQLCEELQDRFYSRTTFNMAVSTDLINGWPPAVESTENKSRSHQHDGSIRYHCDLQGLPRRPQFYYGASYLKKIRKLKVLLSIEEYTTFWASKMTPGTRLECRNSSRYVTCTKLAWLLRNATAVQNLHITVNVNIYTTMFMRAYDLDGVNLWSYLAPLKEVPAARTIVVVGHQGEGWMRRTLTGQWVTDSKSDWTRGEEQEVDKKDEAPQRCCPFPRFREVRDECWGDCEGIPDTETCVCGLKLGQALGGVAA